MRINTYSECVKHCATYRQTKQDTHGDRLTVSSTFNNTYKYNDIAYPTILEDVKLFEIINELCINIYNINDTSGIITHQVGNIK